MRHFFSHLSPKESRLIFMGFFSINSPQHNPERQQNAEYLKNSMHLSGVPNAMQQRMNTTGERLHKTRDQYMAELSQQNKYLTVLINNLRRSKGKVDKIKQISTMRIAKIDPRKKYGGKEGHLGDPLRDEQQMQEDLSSMHFKNINELETERLLVQTKMQSLHAEKQAGIPDPALLVPASAPINAPAEQIIGRPTILTVGEGVRPAGSRLEDFRGKATPEEVDAVMGLEPALREVAATLLDDLPEAEKPIMMSLCDKMRDADKETLDAFFDAYFKDGKALDPKEVTIDYEKRAESDAEILWTSLTPEERAVAEKFITTSLESMEEVGTFEEMTPATQARILKYVERWNKAEPETADKLIAEGMLYLDGVAVDRSMNGGNIDKTKIKLLESNERFMGIISGWIKVIMGWKKLIGDMTKPKEKEVILKKPEEMSEKERETEIAANSAQITTLEKQEKALPAQIKEWEAKVKPDLGLEEKEKIEAKIAALKKELAEVKKKREELEGRNEALEDEKEEPAPKEEESTVEDVELSPELKKKLDTLVSSINSIHEDFENLNSKGISNPIMLEIYKISAAHKLASYLLDTVPHSNVELRESLKKIVHSPHFKPISLSEISAEDIVFLQDFNAHLEFLDSVRKDLKNYSDHAGRTSSNDE